MIELFNGIANFTVLLSTLLAIAILLKFKSLSHPLKIVGIYVIASASIDLVSTALYEIRESNLKFLHLFTLIEIILIGKLFQVLYISLKRRINMYYLLLPIILFIILNSAFIQPLHIYNSYSAALASISIIAMSIYFFYLILDFKAPNYDFIVVKWFIYTIFIYHSVSLIIMFLSNVINTLSKESQSFVWTFRILVILATKVILVLCFTKLFLSQRKLNINE